jgi:Protein of unknown function (DUF3891)
MIVQTAPDGGAQFVITMAQHTSLAGKFARAFGNQDFAPVEPRDIVLYIVDHHDAGWAELDAAAAIDPATGLPYHLVDTPFEKIVRTSAASPNFNSRRHPYCGLLSSMHSWGLYNGRYGLSDKVLLDMLAEENRAAAGAMLDGELARQQVLKAEIAADPDTAGWVDEGHLFQNYKQLQFFDTLALYFNCVPEGARAETVFEHVPADAGRDETVKLRPLGDGVYGLAPYPFAEDGAAFTFEGRYMTPAVGRAAAELDDFAVASQTVTLVNGRG